MGLDFVTACTPTFRRSWDRGRQELAEPSLFLKFPELRERTFRSVAKEGKHFEPARQYLLRAESETVSVWDGTDQLGSIADPPPQLRQAVESGCGVALGTVHRVMLDGLAADLSVA